MCKLLMSINPEYANKILYGSKKYEYRKIRAKRDNIDRIIIYSTYPVMKVIGEVEVKAILEDTPDNLWKLTKDKSGISRSNYNKYYKGKKTACAYQLGKITKYDIPKSLCEMGINFIPQSFAYYDK